VCFGVERSCRRKCLLAWRAAAAAAARRARAGRARLGSMVAIMTVGQCCLPAVVISLALTASNGVSAAAPAMASIRGLALDPAAVSSSLPLTAAEAAIEGLVATADCNATLAATCVPSHYTQVRLFGPGNIRIQLM
jgi:hypothetical protein